jgi:hypothetical protein
LFWFAIPAWTGANGASAADVGHVLGLTALPWTLKLVNGFIMNRYTLESPPHTSCTTTKSSREFLSQPGESVLGRRADGTSISDPVVVTIDLSDVVFR